MSGEPKRGAPELVNAAQFLGYGLTWALSTGMFLMGGWLVDRWLGTMPLFLIAGAFIGAGAGFYSLYYHVVIEPRRKKEGARDLRTGDGLGEGGGGDRPGAGAGGAGGTG